MIRSISLKKDKIHAEFWSLVSEEKYPLLFDFGIKMLSMFGTTYICERGFSDMSYVKSKYRSKLDQASLKNYLRVPTTAFEVDIPALVNAKQAHPSLI